MAEKRRMTVWAHPDSMIDSSIGMVTYRKWCESERARINRRGDTVTIVTRKDGAEIALSR